MKDYKDFMENFKSFIKASGGALLYLFKMTTNFIGIFIISPFKPLIDLGKEYLNKINQELGGFSYKNIWESKNKINESILVHTLSFVFLLGFTIYSVLGMPYGWYKSYINSKIQTRYSNTIISQYFENSHAIQDKYTKDIYEWFTKYNEAYRNRDCGFMKHISVDLSQWEKNYIKNIQIDKKFDEAYVYRGDYKCPSFDKINEKSFWSPIDQFDIELKETNDGKDVLVIANGYFSDSTIENGQYKGLSRRKITLWKLEDWKLWRMHQSATIND